MRRTNWRDCQAWKDEGIVMTSVSNEAVKLYDASLTQYVGWYEDLSLGGLEHCLDKMMQADSNFVMGEVLRCGLDLLGTGRTIRNDEKFRKEIEDLTNKVVVDGGGNERESKHAQALSHFAHGKFNDACQVWEDILLDHPTDILALKFAHDSYFYLGHQSQLRDSVARVLPRWKAHNPLYSYLHGMLSFGLVETNMYGASELAANTALEMNPCDAWATHSVAHVMEMMGRHKEGIQFMSSTLHNWETCGMLACHNFWHWALYHIERGEHEAALGIFDSACATRATSSHAALDVVDVCSLLLRLDMEGVDVGDRWKDMYEVCLSHTDNHILAFNDAHVLMTCVGAGEDEMTQKMLAGIEEYMREDEDESRVYCDAGYSVCRAMVALGERRYSNVVDLLYPIRYDVIKIGGSNAQRDIFNLVLINAALKSPERRHQLIAVNLLHERKALKENAPMTDRLMARAVSLHTQ